VRYAETDKMGVVYYANYLVWFEVGRAEWLRVRGHTYRGLEADGIGLPVVEAACQYHVPGRYDDELEVRTEGRLLSPARVRFNYEVVRAADAVVLATGHTVHAVLNNQTGRPCRLPVEIRTLFQ
jgi:acyl-CoA thioester hydrolase